MSVLLVTVLKVIYLRDEQMGFCELFSKVPRSCWVAWGLEPKML